MEYGGKSKGDGENNARTRKWTNFLEGSGWTSSTYSLPRPRSAYGKSKQTWKRSTYNSNLNVKASITSQHRMGNCNYDKSNQGKIIRPTSWRRSCGIRGSSREGWS